jgi:glycosyltransferase involved in cell wall biosynthesis
LNYTSFAISAAVLGAALVRKPDVIYVYHAPATIGLAAIVIGFLRRTPFVFDINDLWPDTVAASGMMSNAAAINLLDKWCRFVYRRAKHIVVVSPGFKARLVSRDVAPEKIDVIYNWCDETAIEQREPDAELAAQLGLAGRFNVMFAGTMGIVQALDAVLEAAALCIETIPHVQFVFVGGGVDRPRLEEKAANLGLSNIRFLPRQPINAMSAVLALGDVLLVHLKDDPLFSITIPSKIYAYLAVGKPVLMAVRGDAAQLIINSGGGLTCEPEDPRSIADAVARFAAMPFDDRRRMGAEGRRFYEEQLSLKAGVDKFEAIFARTCGAAVPASSSRFPYVS